MWKAFQDTDGYWYVAWEMRGSRLGGGWYGPLTKAAAEALATTLEHQDDLEPVDPDA